MNKVLDAHNTYRSFHDVAPLQWSDECAAAAFVAATNCAKKKKMYHNSNTEYGHGQNIYWTSRGPTQGVKQACGGNVVGVTPAQAVKPWYDEVDDPGFNYDTIADWDTK